MSKRKLPDTIPTNNSAAILPIAQSVAEQETAEAQTAVTDGCILPETPSRRIQKGSPADDFLNTVAAVPTSNYDALTCDLAAIPKDQYNRRRKLIAVIIGVTRIGNGWNPVFPTECICECVGDLIAKVWPDSNFQLPGNRSILTLTRDDARSINMQILDAFPGQMDYAISKDAALVSAICTIMTMCLTTWAGL